MSYSVGQVSGFAGVTVRTLHHYDKAGLLCPGERSPAGYRLYSDADLARLQQILFYRELGFSLDEIAAILQDPRASALDQLRARRAALGVATAPIPFKDLTAVRLADALTRAVRDPSYARAATLVARRTATEDGAGRVAEALERLTPVRY
ncbi:DNA-binding transcriptional MerR regulator [Streptomyces netropsis]|uniref:DNA-binding transcriptional MerR regulator n=1 Tax=Streptomyces netropsis TaxID=55404 RepID=A0A7W7LGA4_STRNE|nr:DNA-binding transcriptional MerR regulator [Streptomyces netropsis]GGR08164.1 hypothetical protein GCM10010219_10570 [Streptomyces netropsis]